MEAKTSFEELADRVISLAERDGHIMVTIKDDGFYATFYSFGEIFGPFGPYIQDKIARIECAMAWVECK